MSDHRARLAAEPYRAWYGTARWKRLRQRQLMASPLCQECEKRGVIVPATTVHHVVPHKGCPTLFWEGELSSVCAPCHDGPLKAEERSGRKVHGTGADGWPLDPDHPWNRSR